MNTIKDICVANGASTAKLADAKMREIVVANATLADFAVPADLSEALTSFRAGLLPHLGSAELQKFIAPHVRVPKTFEYAVGDRLAAFRRPKLAAMTRPRGGNYPYVDREDTKQTGTLSDFGLAIKIDKNDYTEELARAEIERMTRMIEDALLEGTVAMLDSMAVETTISLATLAETTLDRAIDIELDEARLAGGIRPNRILFGGQAWMTRKTWYEAKALAGSNFPFPRTETEFTQELRGETRIMDSLSLSDAGTLEALAGNTIYAFYGQTAPGLDDPSNMKTGFGGTEHVYHGQNEQGTVHVLAVGTNKVLLPVCSSGVVKITLTD